MITIQSGIESGDVARHHSDMIGGFSTKRKFEDPFGFNEDNDPYTFEHLRYQYNDSQARQMAIDINAIRLNDYWRQIVANVNSDGVTRDDLINEFEDLRSKHFAEEERLTEPENVTKAEFDEAMASSMMKAEYYESLALGWRSS